MVGKDKGIGEFEDRTIEIPNLKKKKKKERKQSKKINRGSGACGPTKLFSYLYYQCPS